MEHRDPRHMAEQDAPILNATGYPNKVWCFIRLFWSGLLWGTVFSKLPPEKGV